MQDARMTRKVEEIQGPPTKGAALLLSADATTLLTEKSQILKRWAEHFQSIRNQPSTISNANINRLPEVQTNADLKLLPSLQETIRAVQHLSHGKTPGLDASPAEIHKHGGPQLMIQLTALFLAMWRHGQVPQDFMDATIVHHYKKKGNLQLGDNHGGISMHNIVGKKLRPHPPQSPQKPPGTKTYPGKPMRFPPPSRHNQ
ncbi:unnamed protein product [Schistocephalus solidus]|uniref:Uncharacterized protein n=1 Tax=Schistocephalus solidus TaxID=70667 RepID=A0A183THR6_SCHSO|nr:unnamed protein product [Schistocephalus solidus]